MDFMIRPKVYNKWSELYNNIIMAIQGLRADDNFFSGQFNKCGSRIFLTRRLIFKSIKKHCFIYIKTKRCLNVVKYLFFCRSLIYVYNTRECELCFNVLII